MTDHNRQSQQPSFGRKFRRYFPFAPEYLNMNHGGFGSAPKQVIEAKRLWQDQQEEYPDFFLRQSYINPLNRVRKRVANLIKVQDFDDLVMIPNASTGVNTVVRSLKWTKQDSIVYFSIIYEACEKTLEFLHDSFGVELVKIDIELPITNEEIVNLLDYQLRNNSNCKMAVFDLVSSMPSIELPYYQLVDVCKKYNVLSMIDGAHGIGMIDLDISSLKPDFITCNLHKWLYAPRPCGLLYVDKKHQSKIHSMPISANYYSIQDRRSSENITTAKRTVFEKFQSDSLFSAEFEWTSSTDMSNYLAVDAALDFRRDVCGGEENITRYCRDVAKIGAKLIGQILKSSILENNNSNSPMSMIEIPIPKKLYSQLPDFHQALKTQYHTFIPTIFHSGKLWARVCGQIYLDDSDFIYIGNAIKDVIEQMTILDITENLTKLSGDIGDGDEESSGDFLN